MGSELVSTRDIYNVVRRTLGVMDAQILWHGEITGYIFYNILKAEGLYTEMELAEYTLIGMLHDLGMIKTGYEGGIIQCENTNIWAHSIYGYLFLKNLSPVDDKAEIVLYHHLPYKLHARIKSNYMKAAEYLTLADKMAVFLHMGDDRAGIDIYMRQAEGELSAKAVELFQSAQTKFNFLEKLKTDEYQKELEELFDRITFTEKQKRGFLDMLIYAIDFRSQPTVIHTMSTRTFALELGRHMRVSAADLQILYYGSLLHDIGKIAIPISILEAPRRLTEEEMQVMKGHVVMTDQILRGVMDERIVNVAAKHHEKLDGSGYPKGIGEAELSTLERIIAVADILSALYGKRSYKDAFPPEKIKEILQEDAQQGKICSKVVQAALAHYDEIIRTYEKQRDVTMERYMEIVNQYDSIYERFKEFDQAEMTA
ncbi:MAG: HD domain-containing protein [Lachnospiraceae bacterium]|nr:HD domain-containing protein [Lachnospiraceae bacterium]